MQVVKLVYRDGLGPTFGSLYAQPAVFLNTHGIKTFILSLAPLGEFIRKDLSKAWQARLQEFSQILPGMIERWPVFPSRFKGLCDDTFSLQIKLKFSTLFESECILHCGGAQAAYYALRARTKSKRSNIKIVFHSWGPLAEEFTYGLTGSENGDLGVENLKEKERLRQIEIEAYQNADAVICISDAMIHEAQIKHGVNKNRLFKIPCLVDSQRFKNGAGERSKLRNKLDLSNRFVVVFSGALDQWQKPDILFRIFKLIQAHLENAFFLILTPFQEKAKDLAIHHGLKSTDCAILHIPFKDVPGYLAASDLGLLARGLFESHSKVNLFSSPIKVPEYLVTGCPVVIGDGVGDMSGIVEREQLGLVSKTIESIEDFDKRLEDFLNSYLNSPEILRNRCIQYASNHFDMGNQLDLYLEVYQRLGLSTG